MSRIAKALHNFGLQEGLNVQKLLHCNSFLDYTFNFRKLQVDTAEYPCIASPVFEPYSATYGLIAPLKCTIDYVWKSTPSIRIT